MHKAAVDHFCKTQMYEPVIAKAFATAKRQLYQLLRDDEDPYFHSLADPVPA